MNEAWRDELASSTNKAKSNQMNFTIDSFDWFAWFGWNGIVFFFCFGWVGQASQLFQPAGRDGLWALARHPNKQSKRKKTMEWKQWEREWTNQSLPWIDWAMELMELMEWINQWRRVVFVNGAPRSLAPRQANNSTNLSFLHKRRKVVVLAEWNVFLSLFNGGCLFLLWLMGYGRRPSSAAELHSVWFIQSISIPSALPSFVF